MGVFGSFTQPSHIFLLGPGGHRIWNIRLMPTDSDVLDRFVKMKMIAGSASICINSIALAVVPTSVVRETCELGPRRAIIME